MDLTGPLKAQPGDVVFDGVDVFLVFFLGVGVIKAQVALTAELFSHAKVEADGFGMAHMQVAIGFRRKTGNDFLHLTGGKIFLDDFGDEVVRDVRR